MTFSRMFDTEPYKNFSLVALDPGLNNIGVAHYDIDVSAKTIRSIQAYTLRSQKVPEVCGLDPELYTERILKKRNMMTCLAEALSYYKPHAVACESPFFDRRKPGSYSVLVEVLTAIHETVIDYDARVTLNMVEPLLVKNRLGVAGQKGKEVVKEALIKCNEIMSVLQNDVQTLDEHAIDAIAVGYTWLTRKTDILK